MKTTSRKSLYGKMHALLHELGIMANKGDILSGYGVESSTDLTDEQLLDLIGRLTDMGASRDEERNKEVKKWRSNIILVLTDLGVYKDKESWPQVNHYLLDERIAGKVMYELSVDEMKALHRKLLGILEKHKRKVDVEKGLAGRN